MYRYTMPETLSEDTGFNLGMFILENEGSLSGLWHGKMRVADQKTIFGKNVAGKKTIVLNGKNQRITIYNKVCFGTDVDIVADTSFASFMNGNLF